MTQPSGPKICEVALKALLASGAPAPRKLTALPALSPRFTIVLEASARPPIKLNDATPFRRIQLKADK